MGRLAFFLAFAVAGTSAQAAVWRPVAMFGERGSYNIYFVDFDSINRSGDDVTFSYWQVMQNPENLGYDNDITSLTANCSDKSYSKTTIRAFMGTNLVQTAGPVAQVSATPGSVIDQTIDGACGKLAPGPVTADPYHWAKSL